MALTKITTNGITDSGVTTAKVAADAITTAKITDGTVAAADLASGVTDLSNDSSPQLGGQLDVNGYALGDGSLELLKFLRLKKLVANNFENLNFLKSLRKTITKLRLIYIHSTTQRQPLLRLQPLIYPRFR